jgi:sulfatase maturation enzyme AslB (radical SAM superfamily)
MLTDQEFQAAQRHLQQLRVLSDRAFGDYQLVGYTGGETLVYKDIVYMVLNTFHDKWVRINTNGLLIDHQTLHHLRAHGKAYLAISLDGHTFEANRNRLTSSNEFNRILTNIDLALANNVCVQLMDTINPLNIDQFMEYAAWISDTYAESIASGRLIMCAHFIQGYTGYRDMPTEEQRQNLARRLRNDDIPEIIRRAKWHYIRLARYLITLSNDGCRAFDWARCAHFMGRDLVASGMFKTFACGMYGKGEASGLNINDPDIVDNFQRCHEQVYHQFVQANVHDRCITDWNAIDSIINGDVRLDVAQEWFTMFHDENIIDWFKN